MAATGAVLGIATAAAPGDGVAEALLAPLERSVLVSLLEDEEPPDPALAEPETAEPELVEAEPVALAVGEVAVVRVLMAEVAAGPKVVVLKLQALRTLWTSASDCQWECREMAINTYPCPCRCA